MTFSPPLSSSKFEKVFKGYMIGEAPSNAKIIIRRAKCHIEFSSAGRSPVVHWPIFGRSSFDPTYHKSFLFA